MIIHNAPQGSIEWHESRWAKITSTRASQLFVKSDNLFLELLGEYTEQFQVEDNYESYDMIRGKELEPEARYQVSQYTGLEFNEVGLAISTSCPIIGISMDGLTDDHTKACEIKCPKAKKHLQTCLEGEIPLDNLDQCVHYFTVNPKLESLFFVSYRPESIKPLFVKELKRTDSVNLGTKAKPILKTVQEWVELALAEAEAINDKLNKAVIKLTEI